MKRNKAKENANRQPPPCDSKTRWHTIKARDMTKNGTIRTYRCGGDGRWRDESGVYVKGMRNLDFSESSVPSKNSWLWNKCLDNPKTCGAGVGLLGLLAAGAGAKLAGCDVCNQVSASVSGGVNAMKKKITSALHSDASTSPCHVKNWSYEVPCCSSKYFRNTLFSGDKDWCKKNAPEDGWMHRSMCQWKTGRDDGETKPDQIMWRSGPMVRLNCGKVVPKTRDWFDVRQFHWKNLELNGIQYHRKHLRDKDFPWRELLICMSDCSEHVQSVV